MQPSRARRYCLPAPHGQVAIPILRDLDTPTVVRLAAFRRDQHLFAARASLLAAGLPQTWVAIIMDEAEQMTEEP